MMMFDDNQFPPQNGNRKTNFLNRPSSFHHHRRHRRRHHLSRAKSDMTTGKEERMKELVQEAQKESNRLQRFLQKKQWLPRNDCESEKTRHSALKVLEKVLCQWVASLQSLRPMTASGNAWQRPRGKQQTIVTHV